MFRQKIVPVMLSVFLVVSVFYFVFGDLGILASYEKTLSIRNLQREIDKLTLIRLKKNRELARLEDDYATIRQYALLYGLRGGEEIEAAAPAEDNDIYTAITRLTVPEQGAFLLRHPILIVLALLISLSLFGFFLITRRQSVRAKEEGPLKNKKKNSCINPSWG